MRRALQRQVPKYPHRPSSQRRGARLRDDIVTRLSRAFALMDRSMTFHPLSWTPVRFLADGTTEDLSPDEAAAVMARFKAVPEVIGHGPV